MFVLGLDAHRRFGGRLAEQVGAPVGDAGAEFVGEAVHDEVVDRVHRALALPVLEVEVKVKVKLGRYAWSWRPVIGIGVWVIFGGGFPLLLFKFHRNSVGALFPGFQIDFFPLEQ